MSNANLRVAIKFIFLPALLLSVLLSCSSTLFHFSQNALIGNQLGFSEIPALKASTIIPQIILAFSVLIFSNYKPFEKVFKGTLLILAGIIVLLTGLMFFQEHLRLSGASEILGIYTGSDSRIGRWQGGASDFSTGASDSAPEHGAREVEESEAKPTLPEPILESRAVYKPLVTNWPISLMYIVLSVCNLNLYSLFIWGFINRLTSLSEGIKYYIPLTLVLGGAGSLTSNLGFMAIGASKWPLMAMVIPALVFMICSFFIFNWSWKRLPNSLIHSQEFSISQTQFPFLSAAYLLAGSSIIKNFLDILFKSELKTRFSDAASYSKFMGAYSTSVDSATLVISMIWAVLGTWLILKKGWRTTALYASLSILIGGIIFLGFSLSWLGRGIFNGLLMGTASALFFPLIQILYLYLPYQNRFKAKVTTEMIALPLMKSVPSLATQGLLVSFGSIAAITFYLKIFIPILMVLLVIASCRAVPKE